MTDKFEENIEQQLSNFQLQPDPKVWQQIATELDEDDSKKDSLFSGFYWQASYWREQAGISFRMLGQANLSCRRNLYRV